MDLVRYQQAEDAYVVYDDATTIDTIHLFAWLLAEVAFVTSVTEMQHTVLGRLPENDIEIQLMVESAMAYRTYRRSLKKSLEKKKEKDWVAVRPKEK
jgi:hypothetical protein